jgi:prolyl-tRNA synthetase
MLSPEREDQAGAAASLEEALGKEGHEVLIDDRDASPGVKFNDADLVGLPVQVVLGKKVAQGGADVKVRYTQERREVSLDALAQEVVRALADAP